MAALARSKPKTSGSVTTKLAIEPNSDIHRTKPGLRSEPKARISRPKKTGSQIEKDRTISMFSLLGAYHLVPITPVTVSVSSTSMPTIIANA
ncbi:hypothetical protein D3C80_1952840 [compost metagenome]